MKVKLFIHKNHNLSVPDLMYGPDGKFHESGKFIDVKDDNGNLVYENKSATVSFVEGEEIPTEYLNGDYVQKEEEINDEEITNRLSTFKAEGYRGDFASMAKLMAMGMDTLAVTRALPSILPTTNLQYNDIRDVLNFNGGAVGNNMASLFKESAKINRWSKYKPVTFPQAFTDNYPNWYKGGKGDCGLSLVTSGNVKDAAEAGSWSYVLPKGGEEEPFRFGDFRGYNTKAVPFLKSQYPKGAIVTAIEKSSLNIVYTLKSEPNSLSLSDFNQSESLDFDDCVMYVEVWNYNKTEMEKYQNGYDIITTGENLLEFNPAGLAFGNHKLLLGLKSRTSGRILPIPYSDDNYYEFVLYYRNLASMLAQFNFYSIFAGSNTVIFSDTNAGKEALKVTSSNNFKIVFKVSVPDQGVAFQVPENIYVNTNYTQARELFTRQEAQSTVQPGQEMQFTYTGLIRDLELSQEERNVEIIVTLASQDEVGRGFVEMKL